jgi:small GTP-binding protein
VKYLIGYKIIIGGLDNAGKTSILTAFDKRYDFEEEVSELLPTKKVVYHRTKFLNKSITFWDMGGQKKYRKIYSTNPDFYFSETDMLIYVIDIQDSGSFKRSVEYLNQILNYFNTQKMEVPLIVAFHKNDPELKGNAKIIKNVNNLTEIIIKIEQLKKLFIQTSIYSIITIVELISTAMTFFDEKHSALINLFEKSLKDFGVDTLILFDNKGVIISESYSSSLDFDTYNALMKSIKEHIVLLKKIQEEKSDHDFDFHKIDKNIVSYLHLLKIKDDIFYVSATINENAKEELRNRFPGFLEKLNNILEPILS